ncbi:MAG: hypothetical protein Q8N46_11615 [Anaerolineales bacterium]|nr:hypothetical protein [Thiobacillus sp.]MDP2995755.1 hypothetical protein [Anaerolineales bacterium]
MPEYEYGSKDFEAQITSAIQTGQPFLVKIKGWRKRVIGNGLQHYLRYLDSRRQGKAKRLSTLLLIPYGFVTPTFWVLCVKAEFERIYPSIQTSADALVIKFESEKSGVSGLS